MRIRTGELVALLGSVFAVLFYAIMQRTYTLELFANFGLIAYMGIAATIGVIISLRLGLSKMTLVSFGFAVGLVSWLFGLLVYTNAYFISGKGMPYLSLADVFYLLTYPAMILGAVGMLRLCRRAITKRGWSIILGLAILLYTLDTIYVIPGSIGNLSSPLDIVVTILYPTLDIMVFLLLVPIFLVTRRGMFEMAFAFMCLGAALLALGDLFYTTLNVASLYYDGHPVDLLLFFGCISAGYGFWRQQADLKSVGAH